MFVEKTDDVGMNLLHCDQGGAFSPERRLKPAAVLDYGFLLVPVGEIQVERLLAMEGTDAARACAKSVDQPGKLLERCKLQDPELIELAKSPRGN